jgi:transposase
MKKISTVAIETMEIFKEHQLTIGFDLGDRWPFYCVLDEAGKIILEQKVSTTPEAIQQTFGKSSKSEPTILSLDFSSNNPHKLRVLHALSLLSSNQACRTLKPAKRCFNPSTKSRCC